MSDKGKDSNVVPFRSKAKPQAKPETKVKADDIPVFSDFTASRLPVPDIVFSSMDNGSWVIRPRADVTAQQVFLLCNLVFVLMTSGSALFDWEAYLTKHQLWRHMAHHEPE